MRLGCYGIGSLSSILELQSVPETIICKHCLPCSFFYFQSTHRRTRCWALWLTCLSHMALYNAWRQAHWSVMQQQCNSRQLNSRVLTIGQTSMLRKGLSGWHAERRCDVSAVASLSSSVLLTRQTYVLSDTFPKMTTCSTWVSRPLT